MKKLTIYTVVSAAVLTMLVACGGGSNSDTAPVANATAGSFTADVGTYKTACLSDDPGATPPTYSNIVMIIDAPTAPDKTTGSAQYQVFTSNTCAVNTKTDDLTVRGNLTALGATKTIPVSGAAKAGIAKTANFAYTGFTLSKGSLSGGLPIIGATAKVGYLIEGSKLYVLSGSSAADGLPTSFSSGVLTKQ